MVLPAPGGPDRQEVVAAGGADLERGAPHRLAPDVGQVGTGDGRPGRGQRHGRVGPRLVAPEARHQLAQPAGGPHPQPLDHRGLGHAVERDDHHPGVEGADQRDDARDPPQRPVEARARPGRRSPATASASSSPVATSSPMAMARSSPGPTLRSRPGARLTVTRFMGHVSPLDSSAARTRSRASRQTGSGWPTRVNPGRPWETWTSTATGRPSTPSRVADGMVAITAGSSHGRDGRQEGRDAGRLERSDASVSGGYDTEPMRPTRPTRTGDTRQAWRGPKVSPVRCRSAVTGSTRAAGLGTECRPWASTRSASIAAGRPTTCSSPPRSSSCAVLLVWAMIG